MKKLGLTGGIGSGKTTVAKVFNQLGVPVFNADTEARNIVNQDENVKAGIIALFGAEVYDDAGHLRRKAVAELVFSNQELLLQLNQLVHPAVGQRYKKWVNTHKDKPYTLKEAAILFESGSNKELDQVIVVTAPKEMRIERVMQRDSVSREAVLDRMANQMDEEERLKRADYIIYNDGSQPLIHQVMDLHNKLMQQ
jgi:dephospho-CoA kinase